MNKNQANLFRFPMQDPLGKGVTGLTPTAMLSKDGGEFVASTNSITEADATNAPGLYQLQLTQSECNCDLLSVQISLPNGEWAAQCYNLEMSSAGGSSLTAQDVWEYNGGRTVTNTIPTAADNATAVWGAAQKTVTIDSTQAATLATAAALTTVGDNVTAIKAKTDNLPASPAAVGDAMTLTSAYDAAKTASQFDPVTDEVKLTDASVVDIQTGLSTFDATADAVIINTTQYNSLASATAQAAQTAALETLAASILHWAATASTLTLYDDNGAAIGVYDLTRDSSGNITAIEPHAEG